MQCLDVCLQEKWFIYIVFVVTIEDNLAMLKRKAVEINL